MTSSDATGFLRICELELDTEGSLMALTVKNRFCRKGRLLCLATLTIFLSACNSHPPLHQVNGKLLVDGQPAEGAIVVLHRMEDGSVADPELQKPTARVAADGTFKVGTIASGDGAPEGRYALVVAWFEDITKINPTTGELPIRLSPIYSSPQTTPLSIDVKSGGNDLPPLDLSKNRTR